MRRELRGAVKTGFDRVRFQADSRLVAESCGAFRLVQMHTGTCMAELTPTEAAVYTENPHLRQVFGNSGALQVRATPISPEDRLLSCNITGDSEQDGGTAPGLDALLTGHATSIIHWGQRKLFIAELEFMLLHGGDAQTVIYAGAAPGPPPAC